ncbi:hypothetical protein AB0F17_10550 [Nonomuraea sp. NPDC026600]
MSLHMLRMTAAYPALCPLLGLAALIVQSFMDDWSRGWRPWKSGERP